MKRSRADDRDAKGRAWARRQLERLNRGELPKGDDDVVQIIRAMRRERTEGVVRTEDRPLQKDE